MRRLAAALLAALAGAAGAQHTSEPHRPDGAKSDWEIQQEEREWKEGEVKLPPLPRPEALVEFFVSATSSFRFFVDAPSLSVGADGVVRYTLVARSSSGFDNISYEGIRCKNGTFKIFAYANAGVWSRTASDWKTIEPKAIQRWRNELQSRYFCPVRLQIHTAAEGLDALRRGGHPLIPTTDLRR